MNGCFYPGIPLRSMPGYFRVVLPHFGESTSKPFAKIRAVPALDVLL